MEIIIEILGTLLMYAIALPVLTIITTPYILIKNIFTGKGSYIEKVKTSYNKVFHFWKNMSF